MLISDQHAAHAQLTDFGIACILDVKGFTTMNQRNVRYTPPELMPLEEIEDEVVRPTQQSDIYSLGILFLQVRIYTLCPSII